MTFVAWGKRSDSPGWVIDPSGCHLWTGVCVNGYGRVRVGDKMRLVARVRYEREVGPIPGGMDLDHFVCDNGKGGCCNPLHCRPVTRRENVLRGATVPAANRAKTHCVKGHEYTPENIVSAPSLSGRRNCRICKIAREREGHRRRRAQRSAA